MTNQFIFKSFFIARFLLQYGELILIVCTGKNYLLLELPLLSETPFSLIAFVHFFFVHLQKFQCSCSSIYKKKRFFWRVWNFTHLRSLPCREAFLKIVEKSFLSWILVGFEWCRPINKIDVLRNLFPVFSSNICRYKATYQIQNFPE